MKEFTSLSFALEYCELSLIRTAVPSEHSLSQFDGPAFMLGPPRASLFSEDSISMENVLKLLLDLPESYDNDITEIKQYCKVVVYPNGSKIFTKQNCSECFFVLLSGLVEIRYASLSGWLGLIPFAAIFYVVYHHIHSLWLPLVIFWC